MLVQLSVLLAGVALAQEADSSGLVARVEAHYATVNAMTARFTQTVASPLYGDQVQTGTVQFARPGKMRWFFEKEQKHYVGDGATMWVYLEAEQQVFRYRGWDPSGSPESLLHSLDHLDELFTVGVEKTGPEGHVLTMRPKNPVGLSQVQLWLAADLGVERVVVTDTMETRTELVFTDLKQNPPIAADTFVFTPPAGIEVIDAGAQP